MTGPICAETRVSGFLTPLSVLFSTPESRVGPGPRVEPQDAGLTAVKVGMRARRATAFLERPDRGRHFVLSRWRPAAPWRELGGAPDQGLDRPPCVARQGRKPREKMKIGQLCGLDRLNLIYTKRSRGSSPIRTNSIPASLS